mmetsp:Transcript_1789/g.5947  ORF Transcript_1789/g.5947 Transcript_1789/m.5947 type:complete len:364 (+) Transcript_1789:935-2026(+)
MILFVVGAVAQITTSRAPKRWIDDAPIHQVDAQSDKSCRSLRAEHLFQRRPLVVVVGAPRNGFDERSQGALDVLVVALWWIEELLARRRRRRLTGEEPVEILGHGVGQPRRGVVEGYRLSGLDHGPVSHGRRGGLRLEARGLLLWQSRVRGGPDDGRVRGTFRNGRRQPGQPLLRLLLSFHRPAPARLRIAIERSERRSPPPPRIRPVHLPPQLPPRRTLEQRLGRELVSLGDAHIIRNGGVGAGAPVVSIKIVGRRARRRRRGWCDEVFVGPEGAHGREHRGPHLGNVREARDGGAAVGVRVRQVRGGAAVTTFGDLVVCDGVGRVAEEAGVLAHGCPGSRRAPGGSVSEGQPSLPRRCVAG